MRKKLFLILGGLVAGILLLEGVLQVASLWATESVSRNIKRSSHQAQQLRVLCVGDSFTYGSGAEQGMSYPEQLEKMLKEKYPERSIRVINAGRPGMNSSRLAQTLPQMIVQTCPDVVVIMIGTNDRWQYSGLIFNQRFFGEKLNNAMNKSKVCRLLRIIAYNNALHVSVCDKEKGNYYLRLLEVSRLADKNDFKKAEYLCRSCIAANPFLGRGYVELARCYLRQGRFKDTLDVLKESFVNVRSDHADIIFRGLIDFSRACRGRGNYECALEALSLGYPILVEHRGVNDANGFSEESRANSVLNGVDFTQIYGELDCLFVAWGVERGISFYETLRLVLPCDREIDIRLARYYKAVMDYEKSRAYFQKVLAVCPGNAEAERGIENAEDFIGSGKTKPFFFSFSESGQMMRKYLQKRREMLAMPGAAVSIDDRAQYRKFESEFHAVCRSNIRDMINICRECNVKAVWNGYPVYVPEYVRAEVFSAKGCLVDVTSDFEKVLRQGSTTDYFVPDGHCTAAGYNIIARALAPVLIELLN